MKQPNKSRAGKKRRQKGNGQARLKSEQDIFPKNLDRLSEAPEANPREPASLRSHARRKPQHDEGEQKRKLWERKQSELAARRMVAQSRRAEQESVRKRKMRIVYSITGTVVMALVCALAWYFASGAIQFTA
ncbi:hypothetical protein [Noviherbaspirillum saxi]|uniref:Uncharacterized protein n=1 Tax=Noviherbaspirillum saxi TaxID=2320863 RepID=A0A3A3G148_9BURK|nr:hypothetical protein [Noviherbaspirillum saxi]RJF91793.1 hypothetical protein D3871_24190 [Noviherbaspirillum saxi]